MTGSEFLLSCQSGPASRQIDAPFRSTPGGNWDGSERPDTEAVISQARRSKLLPTVGGEGAKAAANTGFCADRYPNPSKRVQSLRGR